MKQECRLQSEEIICAIVYRQKEFSFYRNQMIGSEANFEAMMEW